MGQACCRASPVREDDRPPCYYDQVTQGLTGNGMVGSVAPAVSSSPSTDHGTDDYTEDWWDAESNASFRSAVSALTLGDALEEWQEELHGDVEHLEAVQAVNTGWRLIPPEVEAAAAFGTDVSDQKPHLERMGSLGRVPSKLFVDAGSGTGEDEHHGLLHIWHAILESLPHIIQHRARDSSKGATALMNEAKQLHANGRILAAHRKLIEVCRLAGIEDLSALKGHSTSLGLDIETLENEVARVDCALRCLKDDEGFMISRDDDLRVLYRHERQSTVHSLKFKAVFPHPVEHILALAHEFDLLPTWNKFCIEALKLAEPSIFESYVYGAQWMMKPFRPMQAMVRARGVDLADELRSLLILIEDADVDDLPEGHAPLPKLLRSRKTVNMLPGSCIKLRPLRRSLHHKAFKFGNRHASHSGSERSNGCTTSTPANPGSEVAIGVTEAELCVHLDPHIPYVPAMLVNFVLGILAPYIYNQMNRVLDTAFCEPEGAFPKRLAEQTELYGMVQQRMAEFAAELSGQNEPDNVK
jgi:hypothetical protein